MRLLTALVLALALGAARAASAPAMPSAVDLFRQFGLFGTWAVDCKAAASPGNPHVTNSSPSPSEIIQEHDLGKDNTVNRYSIIAAQKVSDTEIAVQVVFQPGKEEEERQRLVWAVHDGTLRTLFNQPQGGPVRVKDGVVAGYGIQTPLLHKCQ